MAEKRAAKKTKASRLDRYRVFYYDEDCSPDIVKCGNWEYAKADEKYGMEAVKSGSIMAMTYGAFWAARRAGLINGAQSFEKWGETVAEIEAVEDEDGSPGESQAPPAT